MLSYKSFDLVNFEAGPLTVLFGKNNSGKTNILEALYRMFETDERFIRTREDYLGITSGPSGAVCVDLEGGIGFDDKMVAAVGGASSGPVVEPCQVAFTGPGGLFVDHLDWAGVDSSQEFSLLFNEFYAAHLRVEKPMLRVLFPDWEFRDLNQRVEAALEDFLGNNDAGWLECVDDTPVWAGIAEPSSARPETTWRWDRIMSARLEQITALATDLLPDFVDDSLEGRVNYPNNWAEFGKVDLFCTDSDRPVENMGQGVARWISAAVQMALRLVDDYPGLMTLRDLPPKGFSGQVLLIDEPEAHLHPIAVASVVRWCRRMVDHGFTVMVATHHEEFLRAASDEVTLVHVVKEGYETRTRTLPSDRTAHLLELASDIGMHPASALSLHRAILFVEGSLDQAVLEEYGGLELEGAGVKIIPIHGTKNLEGLVAVELVNGLGIKIGVLLDATDPESMEERSGRKRSSEERKVMRVLQLAEAKGLPKPKVFGVEEDDLLFALPADAVRRYLSDNFPGWQELRSECREALGKGPSDSVDWKSYAREHYALRLDADFGVRDIVRALDLADVPLPSIRRVLDEVILWARDGAAEGVKASG